jgi:hypothetical protein
MYSIYCIAPYKICSSDMAVGAKTLRRRSAARAASHIEGFISDFTFISSIPAFGEENTSILCQYNI